MADSEPKYFERIGSDDANVTAYKLNMSTSRMCVEPAVDAMGEELMLLVSSIPPAAEATSAVKRLAAQQSKPVLKLDFSSVEYLTSPALTRSCGHS